MRRLTRRSIATGLVAVAGTAAGSPASAAPLKLPLDFPPSVAADPVGTQQQITQAEVGLPPLPVADMQQLTSGVVKLWFWPEDAALLTRAATAGPGAFGWPQAPVMCAKHAAFTIPTLLAAGASTSCQAADAAVRKDLADRGACIAVEQPERYVLDYTPAEVNLTVTGSIEGLVGLAGEALSHPMLPANLLPPDFVATLRSVLAKIRHDALSQRVTQAQAAYAQASSRLGASAACFDVAARTKLVSDLAGLTAELDAAKKALTDLESAGMAAAGQDALCLAARSRARVALPFPSLTEAERRFVAFWLGAVYWRMRGGGLMALPGTQEARLYFLQQPFTQIGKLAGGQDGADAAFQIYLRIFEGWGDFQDMGHTPVGGDKYADLVSMTARGQRQVGTAAQLLDGKGYDTIALTAGGLQLGPCYFYGYEPLEAFRYADKLTAPYTPFIEGPTAIGEFCGGGAIALGFAKTLLGGTPTGKPKTDLCGARTCGDDGCGGSCGTCPAWTACGPSGACVAGCAPRCGARACGDNGCGGVCGTCPPGTTCGEGACVVASAPAAPPAAVAPTDTRAASGCGCGVAYGSGSASLLAGCLAVASALARRRRTRSP